MLKDGAVQWLDYSRTPVIGLAVTPTLTCATSEGADLLIYSNNGVKLLAPIKLDSPASFVHAAKHFVLVITCKGTMNAWYVSVDILLHHILTSLGSQESQDEKSIVPASRNSLNHARPTFILHSNGHKHQTSAYTTFWDPLDTAVIWSILCIQWRLPSMGRDVQYMARRK